MSLAMSREEREAFLTGVRVGVLSVADGERGPLACPVWYAYEPGRGLHFVTDPDSRKGRALARARRASFVVQSEELPYRYVSIEGPVKLADAHLEEHVRPIARRYLGEQGGDAYVEATRGDHPETQLLVTLTPERWLSVDYGKRFAAS